MAIHSQLRAILAALQEQIDSLVAGGGSVVVKNEGVSLGAATSLDFVGGEVDATGAGSVTVTIPTVVNISGNAATATTATSAGAAPAGTLTGATLAAGVTASSLTSVGTLTSLTVAGNVTVDTNTFFVDATNNRLGAGTTSPARPFDFQLPSGNDETQLHLQNTNASAGSGLTLKNNSGTAKGSFAWWNGTASGQPNKLILASSGVIPLYVYTDISGTPILNTTFNADGSITFAGAIVMADGAQLGPSANSSLMWEDSGTGDAILNTKHELYINIDSNSTDTTSRFVVGTNRTGKVGGTDLFIVDDDGTVTSSGYIVVASGAGVVGFTQTGANGINSFDGTVNVEKFLEVGTLSDGGIRFTNEADPPILQSDGVDSLELVGGGGNLSIENDLTVGGDLNITGSLSGVSSEYIDLEESTPSNPSAGARVYAQDAGRVMPVYRSPDTVRPTRLGSHIGTKNVMWRAAKGANSAVIDEYGLPTVTTTGGTAVALATTNIRTIMRHVVYTTATAANSNIGWRFSALTHWRGDATGLGGFHAVQRFAVSNTGLADARFFTGFIATTSAIGTTVEPSAMTDMVGVGFDSTHSTLQFMHNDSSGAATCVNTTLTPSTTEAYELNIYAAPNASEILISIESLNGGSAVIPATLSSNLPTASSLMSWHFHVNTGPTGGTAHAWDWTSLWIESDY